jgi:hypothetical protein
MGLLKLTMKKLFKLFSEIMGGFLFIGFISLIFIVFGLFIALISGGLSKPSTATPWPVEVYDYDSSPL